MNKKRLYKSSRNKKICGVCGGIAEYLNMDPTVIRLITAIIALAWGFRNHLIHYYGFCNAL